MKFRKTLAMVICAALTLTSGTAAFAHVNKEAPINLKVPNLAYDDNSIVLTWEKGQDYSDIVDYNVYQDGKFIGNAKDNFAKNSKNASTYMKG